MTKDIKDMKVALVHDWLVSSGGAERVLYNFHQMFPDAPIYTLVYDESKAPEWTNECDIRTTYIQKWPGAKSRHKLLLSFMPKAWESLDLTEYDLVLSSCASCCKGVITRPDAVHVCFCHSPTRYIWDLYYEYLREASFVKRHFMPRLIHKVRMWDYQAAQRVDYFISNSNFVGQRIKKFYGRDSKTINPGVDMNPNPIVDTPDDYYLIVSRFVRYKRVDLAIEACNKLEKHLIVIGSGGEEEKHLRRIAGPTIEFVGRVPDSEMQDFYSHAKAFLFPGMEDFGITPIEAMSAGVPVIAYGKGGALESVVNERTGLLFYEQTTSSIISCINWFEKCETDFNRAEIANYAKSFNNKRFREEMYQCVSQLMGM